MLRVAQGCGFSVNLALSLSHIGGTQHRQSFGIGGHDSVLNAVVDHLHKMTSAIWAAVQVTLFGGAIEILATGRARDVACAGRKRRENRIEALDHVVFPANHHAVAAFQAPYTAAGSHVHVVDPLRRELLGAPDVVDVVGIAAVDEDVIGRQRG